MSALQGIQLKSEVPSTNTRTPLRRGVFQRKCACGGAAGPTGECEQCRQKRLQRKSRGLDVPARDSSLVPPIVHEVLRSSGQPLDAATRRFVEPRFGRDFSRVRLHTDSRAVESARAVNALAYAVGQNIVFGAGSDAPGAVGRRRLLTHELAHVVQQDVPARQGLDSPIRISASDALENEAEQVASAIHSGNPAHIRMHAEPAVARFDIPIWDCAHRQADIALSAAEGSGLPGVHNGPADAYRHCLWSCLMGKECSGFTAWVAGWGHELDWTPGESPMDLHNNAAGRDCGDNTATCDECCRSKLAAGELELLTPPSVPEPTRSPSPSPSNAPTSPGGYPSPA